MQNSARRLQQSKPSTKDTMKVSEAMERKDICPFQGRRCWEDVADGDDEYVHFLL